MSLTSLIDGSVNLLSFICILITHLFIVSNGLTEDSSTPKDSSLDDEKLAASFGTCHAEIDEPCSSGKIIFHLYTNSSEESPIEIGTIDKKLSDYYIKNKATKVLIHGYVGNANSSDVALLRKVYLQKNIFNVIVVDWGELAKLPCYPVAFFSTWQAGKCTALFLENFIGDGNFSKVHVIGFSLGAHVAAFASNNLKKNLNSQIGRITGLDPALPFFASLENAMKLDKDDGDFVDIVHTNAAIFGKIEPTGHVDFYMNGGFSQPACLMASNIPLCSHLMATVYFAESVVEISKGFWGTPCSSHFHYLIGWCKDDNLEERVLMGEKCNVRSRGVYFVKTASQPPYALG